MPVSYLKNRPWALWSREERFFCAALYEHARKDVGDFAHWLCQTTEMEVAANAAEWDIGFEVCFYRDYLWQDPGEVAHEYSPKRTFDLALFSESAVIIIEAKVNECFDRKQNDLFMKDHDDLRRILKRPDLDVRVVALASSTYFENQRRFGKPETLSGFDGRISWKQVAAKYPDPLLDQADSTYGLRRGALVR